MCAINGLIIAKPPPEVLTLCLGMANRLKHRGPDSQNAITTNLSEGLTLGLSHALLSVMSLASDSGQPMQDQNGTLVFNGSIYNFQELKAELVTQGYQFKTQSDTEVLLAGLGRYGLDFCARLRGMFSFGYHSVRSSQLWLVRDTFGTKPLYYHIDKGQAIFSSEYKAILPLLKSRTIDSSAVNDYLRLRYTPENQTLIQEIQKVPCNSVLIIDLPSLSFRIEQLQQTYPTDHTNLEQALETAIKRRSIASNKVAALLSGGIDSSFVCDLLRRYVDELETYTLSATNNNADETGAAKLIASELRIKNHTIATRSLSMAELSDLVYHLDDPYGDPIIMSLDEIFSAIKGHHRIVVTGEGADEIFSGYVHHRGAWMLERLPEFLFRTSNVTLNMIPSNILRAMLPYSGKISELDQKEAIQRFRLFLEKPNLDSYLQIFHLFDSSHLQNPQLSRIQTHDSFSLDHVRKFDFANWLPHSQLFKLDKISMKYSIEAREPFVDVDLINTVNAMPVRGHNSWRGDKIQFRTAAKRISKLPMGIIEGRKTSFFRPLLDSQKVTFVNEMQDVVSAEKSWLSQWLKPDVIERALKNSETGLLGQKRLFNLTCLALWKNRIYEMSAH